jgi:N-acetylglucosamine-6-phosphate deacetylase
VKDGQSRKEDGRLAGSTLTMDRALLNLMEMTQKSLAELIPASSTNAAQWLGLSHKGNIAPGMDADLVFMDKQGALTRVFCRGEEAKG